MKKYTENSETHTEDLTMYHYGTINGKKIPDGTTGYRSFRNVLMSKEYNMQHSLKNGEVFSYCQNSLPKSSSVMVERQFWKKFKMRQELVGSAIGCLV